MTKALALAVVLVSALLAGCGGGDDKSAAQPLDERVTTVADAPMPADGTLPTDGPYVGAWSANLTFDDLSAAAADTAYEGEFRLDLRDDGTYTLYSDRDQETTGRYGAAPDDFLVFTDDTGCAENFAGSGVYQWAVDGDEMTLTLVRPETGGCTGRSDTLTIPRWVKS
jgi:predicted small secreted protein